MRARRLRRWLSTGCMQKEPCLSRALKSYDQLEEHLGSVGWALEPSEVAVLDKLSAGQR